MALSADQIVELQKFQRLLSLLEKTLTASKNDELTREILIKSIQQYA